MRLKVEFPQLAGSSMTASAAFVPAGLTFGPQPCAGADSNPLHSRSRGSPRDFRCPRKLCSPTSVCLRPQDSSSPPLMFICTSRAASGGHGPSTPSSACPVSIVLFTQAIAGSRGIDTAFLTPADCIPVDSVFASCTSKTCVFGRVLGGIFCRNRIKSA